MGGGVALRSYVRRACGVKLYVTCVADALGLDPNTVALVFRKWRYEEKNPTADQTALRSALKLVGGEHDSSYDKMLTAEAHMRAESISLSVLIERNAEDDESDEPPARVHGEDVAVDHHTPGEQQTQALFERAPVDLVDLYDRWLVLAAEAKREGVSFFGEEMRTRLGADRDIWCRLMKFVQDLKWWSLEDDTEGPEAAACVG